MPVKLSCARVLVHVLRCQPLAHKRTELCTRIIREFGQAKSYWDRMLFIDICIGIHHILITFLAIIYHWCIPLTVYVLLCSITRCWLTVDC